MEVDVPSSALDPEPPMLLELSADTWGYVQPPYAALGSAAQAPHAASELITTVSAPHAQLSSMAATASQTELGFTVAGSGPASVSSIELDPTLMGFVQGLEHLDVTLQVGTGCACIACCEQAQSGLCEARAVSVGCFRI